MGIHGLAKLIADHAPGAIKEQDIKNYFGNGLPFYLRCYINSLSYTVNA